MSRSSAPDTVAYKGYLIRTNPVARETWIERNGAFIGYAKNVRNAKEIIDEHLQEM